MAESEKRIKDFAKNKAKNVKAKNIDKVNMELLLTLNESVDLIQDVKCKDSVPFIIWNDFLNKNGTLAPKAGKTYNRYVWGRKVFVDFGMTNIQTELSYPHPAILLYNFANTAIVIPITTDDKTTGFTPDIEECIIKVKSDNKIFPHDSIINIHQMCSIHKERIIKDLGCNVKGFIIDKNEIKRLNSYEEYHIFTDGMNLLDCINVKLLSIFNKVFLNNNFMNEAYYINEVANANAKIERLEKENALLRKSIDMDKKL